MTWHSKLGSPVEAQVIIPASGCLEMEGSSLDAAGTSAATPPPRVRGVILTAQEARPRLVGVWDLVTAEYREDAKDDKPVPVGFGPMFRKGATEVGNVIEYLGENPRGLLMYSSNGFMSVQLMASNRPDFRLADRLSGSSEEVRMAFESFHSYYGRFHVEDGSVLHHIEGCSFPNLVGTSQRRYYELKPGGMSNTAPPPAAQPDKESDATPAPGPSTDPGNGEAQDPPESKDAAAAASAGNDAAAGPSESFFEPDELILRTAPMTMRGKTSVGVLIWRRASGPLGPDENFPGRSDFPPPDFYSEQASMSTMYRIMYTITAIMVLLLAILPAISFSSGPSSQTCKAR